MVPRNGGRQSAPAPQQRGRQQKRKAAEQGAATAAAADEEDEQQQEQQPQQPQRDRASDEEAEKEEERQQRQPRRRGRQQLQEATPEQQQLDTAAGTGKRRATRSGQQAEQQAEQQAGVLSGSQGLSEQLRGVVEQVAAKSVELVRVCCPVGVGLAPWMEAVTSSVCQLPRRLQSLTPPAAAGPNHHRPGARRSALLRHASGGGPGCAPLTRCGCRRAVLHVSAAAGGGQGAAGGCSGGAGCGRVPLADGGREWGCLPLGRHRAHWLAACTSPRHHPRSGSHSLALTHPSCRCCRSWTARCGRRAPAGSTWCRSR